MSNDHSSIRIRISDLPHFSELCEYYWFIPDTMQVISTARGNLSMRKWSVDSDGYRFMPFRTTDGKIRQLKRSHLVLIASGQPRPGPEYQADHINSDCKDDRLQNLRWVTPDQNIPRSGVRHSISDAHTAMARDEQRFGNTMFSTDEIAKYAGTTARTVRNAATGRTHADVPDLPMPTGWQVRTLDPRTGEWEMSEPSPAEKEEMIQRARDAKRRADEGITDDDEE